MKYCTDLILGKAFCIVIFFHFPDSRLKRFPFIFLMASHGNLKLTLSKTDLIGTGTGHLF